MVTIDGPAGSGKSTTARLVARRLGYVYLDTGAMYRAMALKAIRLGLDSSDADGLGKMAERTDLRVEPDPAGICMSELREYPEEFLHHLPAGTVHQADFHVSATSISTFVTRISLPLTSSGSAPQEGQTYISSPA